VSVKGQVQKREVNKYGYLRLKISGAWYGADKKGDHPVVEGDVVEVDAYQNEKGFETFKLASLRKVSGATAGKAVDQGPVASKDEYWAAKEARDLEKEPRINYYAAFERAVLFTQLAIAAGAFEAIKKAKETAKLDILTAFVDEQTQRILAGSYSQEAPEVGGETGADATEETSEASSEDDGKWN
jgi:hypothetical protein